jgi:chromosome segregation ATPase
MHFRRTLITLTFLCSGMLHVSAQPTATDDSAKRVQELSAKLNDLDQKAEQAQRRIELLTFVAGYTTAAVVVFSLIMGIAFIYKSAKDRGQVRKAVKRVQKRVDEANKMHDDLLPRLASIEQMEKELEARQSADEKLLDQLKELEHQLDEKHRTMLVNLPKEIEALEGSLRGALDDTDVGEVATLYLPDALRSAEPAEKNRRGVRQSREGVPAAASGCLSHHRRGA